MYLQVSDSSPSKVSELPLVYSHLNTDTLLLSRSGSDTLYRIGASDFHTGIISNKISHASGTATIVSGAVLVNVTHSLGVTPTAADISVTPTNSLGAAAKFWISNVGASTFRINVDIDPSTGGAIFAWQIIKFS